MGLISCKCPSSILPAASLLSRTWLVKVLYQIRSSRLAFKFVIAVFHLSEECSGSIASASFERPQESTASENPAGRLDQGSRDAALKVLPSNDLFLFSNFSRLRRFWTSLLAQMKVLILNRNFWLPMSLQRAG